MERQPNIEQLVAREAMEPFTPQELLVLGDTDKSPSPFVRSIASIDTHQHGDEVLQRAVDTLTFNDNHNGYPSKILEVECRTR